MSSSDVVYYNITIGTKSVGVQQTNTYGDLVQTASIIAQNTLPVLENPSEYYGSIVRLNIPQFEIPLAYFDVETDASGNVPDINKGIYKWTVAWGLIDSSGVQSLSSVDTKNVIWIRQDNSFPYPPSGVPPTQSPYYFVYDYETVINAWNVAIANAYAVVQAQITGTLVANQPPFFYYNPNTQIIEFYCPTAYGSYNTTGTPFLQVYANDYLENYIHGFKYWNFADNDLHSLINVQPYPIYAPLNIINIPNDASGIPYYKVQQEYISLNYWNMLRNVYITTTMPVNQEAYYIGNANNFLGQNTLLQSTLTDYIPDLTTGTQAGVAGSEFIYNASSLWRIFCLNSNSPLYNISCSIYFTDQNNKVWPLPLFTKQQCNIKFMFIKKHLISNFIKGRI